ncbi:hypothetical protein BH10ACI1_BH10ACI1_22650 [soil metagenome]
MFAREIREKKLKKEKNIPSILFISVNFLQNSPKSISANDFAGRKY